ncbi:Malonyl-[acyl-carrier protein] O-methyltransferase [hydrothermal vent metagenome]|uniref:malonyl-[acyl-carrier protein] O-methyltransferase n=1 Tax=hydrothermal vent metagenome TaxID=652676 RepID=A0A3B0YZD7_9ZZZZ
MKEDTDQPLAQENNKQNSVDKNSEQSWHMLKEKVRRNFNRAAHTYDGAAVLQQEVAARMLERFDFIKQQPQSILDLGCGTGQLTLGLMQRFRQAKMTALDLASEMLGVLKSKVPFWRRFFNSPRFVCADIEDIPLEDNSYDLIVSGLTLQWCNQPDLVFAEVMRLLKPGGLFMFTTFGPDTLKELRECWTEVDNYSHVSPFLDMHDIGDALMRHQYAEPVMDAERLCLTYKSVRQLLIELKHIGANNVTVGQNKKLTTKRQLQVLEQAYEKHRKHSVYPASYEIIYGHAWKPDPKNQTWKKPASINVDITPR